MILWKIRYGKKEQFLPIPVRRRKNEAILISKLLFINDMFILCRNKTKLFKQKRNFVDIYSFSILTFYHEYDELKVRNQMIDSLLSIV